MFVVFSVLIGLQAAGYQDVLCKGHVLVQQCRLLMHFLE